VRAIRQHNFGAPEELRLEEVEDPVPAEGEARICVEAAGIHLIDTALRRGEGGGPLGPPQLPMTPGREVAGVVDQVGVGVDEALLGERVVTDLGPRSGGYAELAVADAAALHLVPSGLSADQAVTLVGTGRTALAIFDLASPTAGDLALVTAAAGGIGTLLVQLLEATGTTVIGAAGSSEKAEFVHDLGAFATVDYSQPDWSDAVRAAAADRPITLGLDGVGGDIDRAALELVGVGGRLVMYGSASGTLTDLSARDLYARGITVSAAIGVRHLSRPPAELRALESRALEAAAAGRLVAVVGQTFDLADAAAAHEAIESRATTGKVVLCP
jgi:NADPH:quinone reductase